jgi:hypothetical protein
VCGPELDVGDHSTEFVDALSWRWMDADNAAVPASASLYTVPWPRRTEHLVTLHALAMAQSECVSGVRFRGSLDA